jgi:hypothetical protein
MDAYDFMRVTTRSAAKQMLAKMRPPKPKPFVTRTESAPADAAASDAE